MGPALNERSKRILLAIIDEYIATGEPVGSRTVARKLDAQLSPATVRNVMADLHERGLLTQPHTSAGRVPTDEAYREYVRQLQQSTRLSPRERGQIRDRLAGVGPARGPAVEQAGALLSDLAHQTALMMTTDSPDLVVRHIEFVLLRDEQILGILVDEAGGVHHRLLETSFPVTQSELVRAHNYLNDVFSGLSLDEVRRRLLEEVASEKARYDTLLQRALELGAAVLRDRQQVVVQVVGEQHVFDHPEFRAVDQLRGLYRAFREKHLLIRLLDAAIEARGVRIFIGAECDLGECGEVSVVAVPFGPGDQALGGLGIIGPKRMDYPRLIPLVETTARLLGERLG